MSKIIKRITGIIFAVLMLLTIIPITNVAKADSSDIVWSTDVFYKTKTVLSVMPKFMKLKS